MMSCDSKPQPMIRIPYGRDLSRRHTVHKVANDTGGGLGCFEKKISPHFLVNLAYSDSIC